MLARVSRAIVGGRRSGYILDIPPIPAPPSLPAWYSLLAVNQVRQFPASRLSLLDPCPARTCSYSGIDGQAAIMSAWCGAVFDPVGQRLLVNGGGHNDYGGNEVCAFSLRTGLWSLLTQPSDPAKRNDAGNLNPNGTRYADGRISARHTAGAICWSVQENSLFSTACGASFGNETIQNLDVDSFNVGTGTWKIWPNQPGLDSNGVGNGTICGYHPVTHEIWAHPSGIRPLSKLVPSANGGNGQWTEYSQSFCEYLGTAFIDPVRNRFIVMGSSPGRQFKYWDLNNPNAAPIEVATTGAAGGIALESAVGPGFVYDTGADRYLAWHGGSILYALNPVTWVWTAIQMTGAVPGAAAPNGTYGRFAYSNEIRGVMGVSATNENVWFCRL